jgi:DNA-binding PadR family transcriptional regulator
MKRDRRPSPHTVAVLVALTRQQRTWHYGYELSQMTALMSGTLYPILMRLCERGMLESKWQAPTAGGRPPRHLYRLTTAGMAFAREAIPGQPVDLSRETSARAGA